LGISFIRYKEKEKRWNLRKGGERERERERERARKRGRERVVRSVDGYNQERRMNAAYTGNRIVNPGKAVL
jgi:hypothetical protein